MNRQNLLMQTVYLSLIILVVTVSACSDKPSTQAIPRGGHVVALGDSLTFGYGAAPNTTYPNTLAQLSGWQVVNAGINGNTSAQVLSRSDIIVAQHPDLVLLGVGGNDVLQRIPAQSTVTNINMTIDKFKAADIPVVLIAEPHFSTSALFGKASDNPIYADIAKAKQVPLFDRDDGGWSKVLSDESLRSDQIHANAAGYQLFAKNLYEFLDEHGYAN